MKICAIICEYNPFHLGHLKHLQESKEKSGADAILCIMSGNFCQRGEPTIINKYARARMAIESGADIVVQMPTAYACSNAEIFALAGVKIANSFENVTHLSFGCETKNYELLQEVAKFLTEEPEIYKTTLKKYLSDGNSLPVARTKAIEELMQKDLVEFSEITEVMEILQKPNNILALEYLKALYKTKSKIQPVFSNRGNSEYLSDEITGKDTSATAIRSLLYRTNSPKKLKSLVPNHCKELIKNEIKINGLPDLNLFNNLCLYALKTKSAADIKNIYDVSEGLENRIVENAPLYKDLQELLLAIKSKRYTYTRIKRIVVRLLLNIDKKTIEQIYKVEKLPFIKVLAFKSDRPELLESISANTNLIIRNSNIVKKPDEFYKKLASTEDNANAVYNMLLQKSKSITKYAPDLYTRSIKY